MRIVLLACTVLAVIPGVASSQITFIPTTYEEAQAYQQDTLVTHEARKAIDVLEMERLKDPDYRKSRVAGARFIYEKVVNVRDNPGYAKEQERSETLQQFDDLRLSEAEYGKLLDTLAEFEIQKGTLHLETSFQTVDFDNVGITPAVQAAAGEWLRRSREIQTRKDESVAALLGPARYELWQKYLKNRTRWYSSSYPMTSDEMMEVTIQEYTIQGILAKAHQPLTASQVVPLVKALMAGVQREKQNSGRREDEDLLKGLSAFQDEIRKRIKENHVSLLKDVAPHLNEQQLAALTAGFAKQGNE